MAPILLAIACLVLTGCRPVKAAPSPAASGHALRPLEMSLRTAEPSKPEGYEPSGTKALASPPPRPTRSSRPPLARSPKPSPSDTLWPAGSPPRIPRPEDIAPKSSPGRTQQASAKVPASGPFSLVSLGIRDFKYPEDYDLGPLEAKPSRADPKADPSALAYAFMDALSARKETEALVLPERSTILSQALRPYANSKIIIAAYRVGALVRSDSTAEARIFVFGEGGSRAVAELYMSKGDKGWGVEGFAGDLTTIVSGPPPPKGDFEPADYRIFSY